MEYLATAPTCGGFTAMPIGSTACTACRVSRVKGTSSAKSRGSFCLRSSGHRCLCAAKIAISWVTQLEFAHAKRACDKRRTGCSQCLFTDTLMNDDRAFAAPWTRHGKCVTCSYPIPFINTAPDDCGAILFRVRRESIAATNQSSRSGAASLVIFSWCRRL